MVFALSRAHMQVWYMFLPMARWGQFLIGLRVQEHTNPPAQNPSSCPGITPTRRTARLRREYGHPHLNPLLRVLCVTFAPSAFSPLPLRALRDLRVQPNPQSSAFSPSGAIFTSFGSNRATGSTRSRRVPSFDSKSEEGRSATILVPQRPLKGQHASTPPALSSSVRSKQGTPPTLSSLRLCVTFATSAFSLPSRRIQKTTPQ